MKDIISSIGYVKTETIKVHNSEIAFYGGNFLMENAGDVLSSLYHLTVFLNLCVRSVNNNCKAVFYQVYYFVLSVVSF